MADYISKYTGAQIDLAVSSGSTVSGHITSSGNLNVGGIISASGKIYSDDEIHLRDGSSAGDTLIKIYPSGDDGIIDIYQDNSVKTKIKGNGTSWFNGGNVNIGTTVNDTKLQVAGTFAASSSKFIGDITASGNISGSSTSTGSFGQLSLKHLPTTVPLITGSLWISGSGGGTASGSGYLMIFTG